MCSPNPRQWLAAVVLANLLALVPCQTTIGLSLGPGYNSTILVSPTTNMTLPVVWNAEGDVNVTGLFDDDVINGNRTAELDPFIINAGTNETQGGNATFNIDGSTFTLGIRYTLTVTVTLNETESENMTVLVLCQEPISGLSIAYLTGDNVKWVKTDQPFRVDASVATGSDLHAEWVIQDQAIVYQSYPTLAKWVMYTNTSTSVGAWNVTLIVSNEHNAVSKTFTLRFLKPINGLSLDKSEITSQTNKKVDLRLLFANDVDLDMGEVSLFWKWTSQQNSNSTSNLTIVAGSSIGFEYNYTTQGNFTFTVTLKTNAESKNFHVLVYIWDQLSVGLNITAPNMTLGYLAGKPGDDFFIAFTNPPAEGFQYIIEYEEGGNLTNDESVWYSDYVAPSRASLTFSFTDVGVHRVTLTAFNGLYQSVAENTVIIENPLIPTNCKISVANSLIPTPDGKARAKLTVPNSLRTTGLCKWDFGAGDTFVPVYKTFPETWRETYFYDTPGNYTITLQCHNNISDMTFHTDIAAKGWYMNEFVIDASNPQAMDGLIPTSNVSLRLALQDIVRPPEEVTVTFTFGDGSTDERFDLVSWETLHAYPLRNVYNGKVVLVHPNKGSFTLNFEVRQGAFQIALDVTEGLVLTQPFVFTVEVPGPFSGTLQIDFGDELNDGWSQTVDVLTPTTYTATYYYQSVDEFTAKLTGTEASGSYTENVDFPGPIITDGAVTNLVLLLEPEQIKYPPGDLTITFRLDRPDYPIRLVHCWIDFDEVLDPDLRSWNGSLAPGGQFVMDFHFETLGDKNIKVNCTSPYSNGQVAVLTNTYNPCFSNDPIFDRQYGVYFNPMQVLTSKPLRLVTRTVVMCTSPKPSFHWWLHSVTRLGVEIKEHTDLVQPNVDYLTFPPGALKPGIYKMSLNISFGVEHNYVWLKEYTFVKVVRTPLEAEIAGGAFRLTGDRSALLDGYTLSYDPVSGLDNKTGLEFLWECHCFNSSSMEELIAVANDGLPDDSLVPCDDISVEHETGKRKLTLADDVSAKGFSFKLQVQKEEAISTPSTLFMQYRADAFAVSLVCEMNCERKVATTSILAYTMDCKACSDGDMLDGDYNWTLSAYNNITTRYEAVPDMKYFLLESGHDNGQAVSFAANRLKPCSRYRVIGHMSLPYDTDTGSAVAGRDFLTNCPPWGGKCAINPTSGDVVLQRFNMSCSGWQDDGFTDPTNLTASDPDSEDGGTVSLHYQFMIRKNHIILPIDEGGESNMARNQLPIIAGQEGEDYEIVIRIFDALFEYTEYVVPVLLKMSSTGAVQGAESNSTSQLNETMTFWEGQADYTELSTLNKQLRGLTTASSLLTTYKLPDTRSSVQQAAATDGEPVVTTGWDTMWNEMNNPATSAEATQMTELTERFTKLIQKRDTETQALTGQGIAALGEGMAAIIYNKDVTDDQSIFASSDVALRGTDALRKLFSVKPYPMGLNVTEAVFSMSALVDKVIDSSLPSYDLSLGPAMTFNASDVGEDDSTFMISRFKIAQAMRDKHKINTTQSVMPRLEKAVNTMLDSMLSGVVLGQPNQEVRRGQLTLAAGKVSGRTLADTPFNAGSMRLKLDSVNENGSESDRDATVDVRASVFIKNPLAWSSDDSSYEITSPVVRVNMTDKHGPRKLKNLTLSLKRGTDTPVPTLDEYSSDDTKAGSDGWLFHRLTLRSASSAVITQFALPSGLSTAVAYFRTGRPPIKERYDLRVEGELLTGDRRKRSTRSVLQFFVGPNLLTPGIIFVGFEMPELPADHNETLQYQFMSFSDACRVWDETTSTWDATACKISAYSTPEETVCICENPPGMSFASSFFVAPNTIDFSTVFSKFDITNAAVYGTLIALFAVWVLGVVWARRKDKQDKERWLVGYLRDNLQDDSYFYLLTVHTGVRKGAGTQSNVRFIMSGDRGDTGVRVLSDGKRTLDTGSVMTYILATTQSCGDLQHVRIWHDDTGFGDKGSWYLSRFIAEDLQSGQRYNFICEKWLALDKEDGLIDRFVPVTLKDEVMTFDKLFSEHARVGITDAHLWFSCFLRPERSTFTRVQRVSCCLALLLLTMITSAMFYTPDVESGQSNTVGMEVQIGMLRFSMTTLWTSTVSIIITTIPLLLFVVMFRSYRPKWGPRAQAQAHKREGLIEMTKSSKVVSLKKKEDTRDDKNVSDLLESMLQQNPLPHVAVYAAWLLLLATMALSAFFLLLYSMQWGTAVSEEWLASFVLSFFESIFLMDPVKVLLLACLLAYCASNPYLSTHKQHVDIERVHIEAETFGKDEIDPTALPPDPVPESVVEAVRKRRHEEQLAQSVFFELVLQIFFVFCVFSVSYGNRDQKAFSINQHLQDLMYSSSGNAPFPFEKISTREDVMEYIKQTLVPVAFPSQDIAGNELNWKRRLFASDFTSFRVGPVRVRQVRMPNRKNPVPVTRLYPSLRLSNITFPPYDMDEEETGNFCLNWRPDVCTDDEISSKLSLDSWKYTSDVIALSVWGTFALYPSSGYKADFAVNKDVVENTIKELKDNVWLDLHTRAVFVELSVYNPNVNLFTFIRMGTEFPEVGANVVWKVFKTIRIYNHLGAMGAYVLVCEIIVAIIIVVFSVKTAQKIKKQGCAFLTDFWQVLDGCTLIASYFTAVFYVVKLMSVKEVMALWRQDPKVYVDFYLPVLWDEVYGYLLAALVFVVSLRIMRVLGYNKRVTMIAEVLARSGTSLFSYALIFLALMTAYVCGGVVLFASSMPEFRSVWESYCTLYVVLLGKNVLGRFIEEAPLSAQLYFISLTVFVILILYTMFQAILCNATSVMKSDMENVPAPYGLTNVMAILCNATSVVKSDIENVPAPYGLTNVLTQFFRAAVADWVPQWIIKSKRTVDPNAKPVAGELKPGYKPTATLYPPPPQDDNRTQPHRVLATLSDHFNTFYQGEEPQQKTKRRRKKKAFTNLNDQDWGFGTP